MKTHEEVVASLQEWLDREHPDRFDDLSYRFEQLGNEMVGALSAMTEDQEVQVQLQSLVAELQDLVRELDGLLAVSEIRAAS